MGVTHTKVNGIASWTQTDINTQIAAGNLPPGTTLSQVVVSSDWNATHTFSVNSGDATNITGLIKGSGSSLSAASAGTDYQGPITLTTTGTSGAATFTSNTLNIPQYSGGGITVNTLQIDQTPSGGTYGLLSGAVNGSNTVFTVSNAAYASGSLMVFLNGQDQTQGVGSDWQETSAASGTFTFSIAPPTGAILQAAYIKTSTSSGVNLPVANIGGISGTATGSTLLYTNSSGSSLLVEDVVMVCTAANTATNGPTIQIGSTPTGSDVYASVAITALTVVNKVYHFGGPGMSIVIPNGGTLYMDITSGATATSLTLKAVVVGYFI